MTNDATPTSAPLTPAQFPPIPLFSGNAFADADGTLHIIQTATVTMTAEDGTTNEVVLDFRLGGWWAPAPGQ